ncbi:hypothetical protein XENOCAPTIV_030592 [Xenoophorus captivus]|uniref:Nck-associated protein 5 C-terminal domain-containing protein n=1 Tax=Xenoophorus captivus TaxID=1517983 RepID=A0ABV0RJU3_9TELE
MSTASSVQQLSPLASPVKQSKILKSPGIKDSLKSPTKKAARVSSDDSVEESIYDNLPCSPRKQRRQEQHCDTFRSERRSPSPPLPPGRSTSLLLRTSSESAAKDEKLASQTQSYTTGKPSSAMAKTNTDIGSVLETQQSNIIKDNQHADLQMKDIPVKIYYTNPSKIPHVPGQESQASDSVQLDRNTTCLNENGAPSISTSQSILQRSPQSISEPKLSEVLPTTFSNVYYHGIPSNPQTSTSNAVKRTLPVNAKSHEAISGQNTSTFLIFGRQSKEDAKSLQTFQTFTCDPQVMHEYGAREKPCRKIETRCNSLDSEPLQPVASDTSGMLDWGFDEEGWLFKRSVSVSTRPLLKPVLGMNGAKARSQSFGARYMDRPSFNRSGKVRTQIKTHSGSSLNSLGDVLPGSMSCSSSYHCPMNRSLLNNFLIEEGLTVPSHLGSSSERLQSLKLQREQARRLQIEQQFSSAFGEPVSEEPERQSTITTIEEKVMLGIEENLHKSQEHEKTNEVKQKSGSSIASCKNSSLLNFSGGTGRRPATGCKMRTLDSGIGTIPLPESCSFFSSILNFLPKSSSIPERSLSPPSVPGSSSEDVSPSPLPRWRVPSSFKDSSHAGVPTSLSDSSMIHIPAVPFPTVAFLQPLHPLSEPIMTPASLCDTQSRLPTTTRGKATEASAETLRCWFL